MTQIQWKPVVVGVDDSTESASAAAMGWKIAQAAGTDCYLVHGTREVSAIPVAPPLPPFDPAELSEQLTQAARTRLEGILSGTVPAAVLEHFEVRLGNGAWAIRHAVEDHDAGLVVVGGKHHAPPARWLGGSTAHHVVRTVDVPLMITWSPRQAVRRILVAVDLSYAAQPTLETAAQFAKLFSAQLRILHVIEELPYVAELPMQIDPEDYRRQCMEQFGQLLARVLGDREVEHAVHSGTPSRVIVDESGSWDADLVIVGSHGRGWVDRLLIGSTTERLINHLPTSLLVVPVRASAEQSTVLRLTGATTKRAKV